MRYCSNCGNQLGDNETQCLNCGLLTDNNTSVENQTDFVQNSNNNETTNMAEDILNKATRKINELAGENGSVKLHFRDLFSSVFKKHTANESEEIFISGTTKTTPDERSISSTWPKPWLFSRVFLMFLVTFLALYICFDRFKNINALPGLIFIGAMAVPMSLVIFFMEVNAPRNISFLETIKIFFVGGAASILVSLTLFSVVSAGTGYAGAIITGIIEETGKAIIIAWFVKDVKHKKFLLAGMLIGSAVGAGFAAFETAGYILGYGMGGGKDLMFDVLILRAILTPGGHVIWGAILGGTLMLVKKDALLSSAHLFDKRFISFYILCVAMHSIWDMPIKVQHSLVQAAMTVCAWIIALVLINVGLKEVSRAGNSQIEN